MARDKGLEELIHAELGQLPGISGKAMFGGWAWLLRGHLLCAARHDGMLVRLGKGLDAWALEIDGVVPMRSGGRIMQGWIRCGPDVYDDAALRERLLSCAIEFTRSLPDK